MTAPSLVSAVAFTSSSSHFTSSAFVVLSTSVSMKENSCAHKGSTPTPRHARHLVKPTIYAVDIGDFAGLGAFDVAAALDRQIDDHRARLHRSTMSAVTSRGAGRPGISAVVMTMSCF